MPGTILLLPGVHHKLLPQNLPLKQACRQLRSMARSRDHLWLCPLPRSFPILVSYDKLQWLGTKDGFPLRIDDKSKGKWSNCKDLAWGHDVRDIPERASTFLRLDTGEFLGKGEGTDPCQGFKQRRYQQFISENSFALTHTAPIRWHRTREVHVDIQLRVLQDQQSLRCRMESWSNPSQPAPTGYMHLSM